MHSSDSQLQQWRNEIATFVTETKRQLNELRDLMAQEYANHDRVFDQSGSQTQDPTTELPASNVDQQLALLEQTIARRLQQTDQPKKAD